MLKFIFAAAVLVAGAVQANEIWTVKYDGSSTFYYDPQECLNCAPVTTAWTPILTFETPTSADGVYVGAFGPNSVGNSLISISLSHSGITWGFNSVSNTGNLVIKIVNGEVQAVNGSAKGPFAGYDDYSFYGQSLYYFKQDYFTGQIRGSAMMLPPLPIPEPSTYGLMIIGMFTLLSFARRREYFRTNRYVGECRF